MRWLYTVRLRARSLLRRHRIDAELDREIRFHLEQQIAENVEAGMSEDEARDVARRAVGNLTGIQEQCRDERGLNLVDDVTRDVSYALHVLRRHAGFTTIAVLTLGLGIGVTTAVFSVVNAVLLRPLPYPNADRLVSIVENLPADQTFTGRPTRLPSMTTDDFEWWRRNVRTLSHMAVVMPETRTVTTPEGTVRLTGERVSPALFVMRQVRPMLGRGLAPDEERADARVVVLSEATWRRHYDSAADVVGRDMVLDDRPYTVVGVMPPAFGDAAFWMPYVVDAPRPGVEMVILPTFLLREDVSLEAAAAEIETLGNRLRDLPSREPGQRPRFDVVRTVDRATEAVRPALRVLMAAVLVVLLIVCTNVANLLLVRGAGREGEIVLRRALGAAQGRIVRQLLTESLVLALVGGIAGAGIAYVMVATLGSDGVITIPNMFLGVLGPLGGEILIDEVAVNPRVLALALGLSLLTGVVFGLAPALRLSRAGSGSVSSLGRRRLDHVLAVLQLALATTLLVGAGLLLRSFVNLSTLHLGFDRDAQVFHLVTPGQYSRARTITGAYELAARLRELPGVNAAGFVSVPPLGRTITGFADTLLPPQWEGQRTSFTAADETTFRPVSPGYLQALGVRLLEGRSLDERDGAGPRRAMLVSRAWRERFSRDRSPVGTTVLGRPMRTPSGSLQRPWEVVGVVDDIRWRMDNGPQRQTSADLPLLAFVDVRQFAAFATPGGNLENPARIDLDFGLLGAGPNGQGLGFAVRTGGEPVSLAALRTAARAVDPLLTVDGLTTMGERFSAVTGRHRFYASLVGMFGGIAAGIAAIGIYGVVAYSISRRIREFGIRLALGATPRDVLGLVLRHGALLVCVGVLIGLAGAAGLTRYLSGMLFGLTPVDLRTYAIVGAAFAAVALLASFVPARRATQVDPVVALRYE